MDYIHRLPFIMGSFMAIVIGVINYRYKTSLQDVYLKMAIGLIVFFAVGVFVRSMIVGIKEELEKKREQQEKDKKAAETRKQAEAKEEKKAAESGQVIDYRVDEGEDFTPMKVGEVLSSTLKE